MRVAEGMFAERNADLATCLNVFLSHKGRGKAPLLTTSTRSFQRCGFEVDCSEGGFDNLWPRTWLGGV